MTPTDPEAQPALNYAVHAEHPRHQLIRRTIVVMAIGLCAGLIFRQAPRLWLRAQLLYYQHECVNYSVAPNQVVLVIPANHSGVPSNIAPPLKSFYNLISHPGMQGNATVFMHGLRSTHEHFRIVAITAHVIGRYMVCSARVFIPGDFWTNPRESSAYTNLKIIEEITRTTRVFAGATDPADASHFTFIVDDGVLRKEVNGWLDNGDHIRFEVHDVSATQPAPTSAASLP